MDHQPHVNGSAKKHLAILFGGQSTEHEVSLRSSITVIKSLDRSKYDLTLIAVDKQGQWMLCDEGKYLSNADDPGRIALTPSKRWLAIVPGHIDGQFMEISSGKIIPPIDVAFSLLHGSLGEDGSVQGLLKVLNIPFVGSDVLGSAVCMDKEVAKRILRDSGISVTPWVTLLRNSDSKPDFDAIAAELGLPMFVKPASLGSSIGVSKVEDRIGFEKAVELAFRFDQKVLVETAIVAREIETAVIGNGHTQTSLCGEIELDDEFYTYNSKYWVNGTGAGLVVPANLPPGVSEKMQKIAQKAFRVLGCGVTARIDFFLTKDEQILINEINTLPGFTPSSVYPQLWKASGIECPELVDKLLLLALERTKEAGAIKTER